MMTPRSWISSHWLVRALVITSMDWYKETVSYSFQRFPTWCQFYGLSLTRLEKCIRMRPKIRSVCLYLLGIVLLNNILHAEAIYGLSHSRHSFKEDILKPSDLYKIALLLDQDALRYCLKACSKRGDCQAAVFDNLQGSCSLYKTAVRNTQLGPGETALVNILYADMPDEVSEWI